MESLAGRIEKVKEVFNLVQPSAQMRQEAKAWNIYVDALGKAGELRAMDQALSKMKQQGVQPCKVTFNSILNAYASRNQLEQMERIGSLMKQAGIEMDIVHHTTLMKGWNQAGRVDKVKEIFDL